jgi:hypothetical protein
MGTGKRWQVSGHAKRRKRACQGDQNDSPAPWSCGTDCAITTSRRDRLLDSTLEIADAITEPSAVAPDAIVKFTNQPIRQISYQNRL